MQHKVKGRLDGTTYSIYGGGLGARAMARCGKILPRISSGYRAKL